MNKPIQTKRFLTLVIVTIITIHLCLASIALILSLSGRTSRLLTIYQRYALPGPYFTDRTITSSHHLYVGFNSNGHWKPLKDYAQEDFEEYCNAPWRYDKLVSRRYPLYLASQVSSKVPKPDALCGSSNITSLKTFYKERWTGERIDSITFLYCSKTYDIKLSTYDIDTVFSVTCNDQ